MTETAIGRDRVFYYLQSLRNGSYVDTSPPYDGIDPCFHEEPVCIHCLRKPAGLLRCSRCQTAWYCNSSCQKADYEEHKEICLCIAREVKLVERLAVPLRSIRLTLFSEPENLFETRVGTFAQVERTRPYTTARGDLMETYMRAAYAADIKDVWEIVLSHALELMRMDATGSEDVRYGTPFTLLNLHRDDDAFDFIRYWMKRNGGGEDVIAELLHLHAGSEEGDWLYPREKNCRFLDFFEECTNITERDMSLAYLVALLVIKLRIVAAHTGTRRAIDSAFETTGGQKS